MRSSRGGRVTDVVAYDRTHRDVLHMADMLSRGIIAHFPRRF